MACEGQFSVSCSLCEEDTRIEWKCLNCDMLMCDKCKEKIHVKFKFAKDHKVVSIHEVGLHAEEIDFSNLSCKSHTRQSCVMFCKSCDCLVCPLCISETHNGHGLVAIGEGYEIKIEKLKTGQMNIRTNIDELQRRKAEMKYVHSNELSKFENTMKKIKDQNVLLKKEVDQHTEKLETELIKKWEDLNLNTEKGQNEVNLLIGSLESKNLKLDDIIQSMDAKKVFVDGSGLVKSIEEAVTFPCTKFDSIPTFLPEQITAYNIGSLEKVSTKDEIKIIKQFDTKISDVYYMAMAAGSVDALWISDQDVLQKVKIEGTSLEIIAQKDITIYGMAITPSKDLLLVCNGSRLMQISDQTGEVTKSRYEVKDLEETSAVHVDSDGTVTVGAFSGEVVYPAVGRRVVIVMNRNGKHETTYEYDKQGNHIFTYVKNITRTKNGNTCVVDRLSKDKRGRVVILSEDGDIMNLFNGHPEVNTDKIPFRPFRAVTTPSDNIVVSNENTDILFFLNSSGNLIRWCDMGKIGIFNIYSLCISESGHLYIGKKGKIYEVIERQTDGNKIFSLCKYLIVITILKINI
ncbi:uncharacterized protein LOC127724905 [Mytilus californianus]|uniref:uncharacterized protein LOC127724905 n=1 Tax=Mytilus californianus TaxID=6549 RepID=UPI002247BAAB|nr:uncharacterized protein LOC127724905 [Mytilus californianus]